MVIATLISRSGHRFQRRGFLPDEKLDDYVALLSRIEVLDHELVSAYMRYVKAKHKRNVTELLPGYKGHVIAERLVFQSFCPLIRELLSAYRRYVNAKLCVCESMMLDKHDEKLTRTNTLDMKALKQITKA
ncbi:hypothetical protein E3N88_43495 [Mikania micrantha]|uniref:Uncharacterized protein n=1 Tax=Mikania micrantha TaxID=192012 RepID=A0A5N6LET0_9ASTR|nr:hypothetical protein E3N88_43495 [Mikania micrantha]